MNRRRGWDSAFILGLFLLFMLTAAAMLLLGVRVYGTTQQRMEENFAVQTPLSYVAAKARQHTGIRVSALSDGTPALELEVQEAGEWYTTYLYEYDGALYEQYTPRGYVGAPEDGQRLIEVQQLRFTQQDGLIQVQCCTPEGTPLQLLLTPRQEEMP